MELCLFATLLLMATSASASPFNENQRSRCEDDGAALVNITTSTSPFENILNVRITTPDAVHSTPAIVLVGTNNNLQRCLYENPNECEILFNTGENKVYSLLISGEYIYAGIFLKVVRCNLNQKEFCEDFRIFDSEVMSLSSMDEYLFVGLYSGTIVRCLLNEPMSCRPLINMGDAVYSLIQSNGYIYVGMSDGRLIRCLFTTINTCSLEYRMSDAIMGLTNNEKSIFAITQDGFMWNCTEKSDATIENCVSVPLNNTNPLYITSFNGILYIIKHENSIYKCNWPTNTDCAKYGNIEKVYSMAFAYGTYQMQSRYRNEDTSCVWQNDSKCPPYVTYYNVQQRAQLEVQVKDGRLYNAFKVLVDTSNADEGRSGPAAIFAMGPNGKILLSNRHITELLHTSSLFAGNPVSGVGEMIVKNGVIQKIRACSDHYQPDTNLNRQVVQSLQAQGYTEHIDSVKCSENEGFDPTTQSNTVQ